MPADSVRVDFRLPTYWCAANFAFLMADDMRIAVAALPWVRKVTVGLGEHMYADEINRGVAAGLSFQATFGRRSQRRTGGSSPDLHGQGFPAKAGSAPDVSARSRA